MLSSFFIANFFMQEIIPTIIQIIREYGYIIVFFGAVIGGETFILAAAFLASIGYLNIFLVILISFLGSISSDSVWYLMGLRFRNVLARFTNSLPVKKYRRRFFDKYFYTHYGKFLVISKFIYGMRIATLLASGYKKLPYKKFIAFNLLGNAIWLMIVIALGYLMGFSWHYLARYNNYLRWLVIWGLIALFAVRLILNKVISINNQLDKKPN